MGVGYWPKALFTGLADHAMEIYWGGEVHGPVNDSPQMGSGHFAVEQYGRACFMANLEISKEGNGFVDADTVELTPFSTSDCYTSLFRGRIRGAPCPQGYDVLWGTWWGWLLSTCLSFYGI